MADYSIPADIAVKAFEKLHKIQFYNLAVSNKLWLAMAKKYGKTNKQAVIDYGKKIIHLGKNWLARQRDLEKHAHIPKIDIYAKDFFNVKSLPIWEEEVK